MHPVPPLQGGPDAALALSLAKLTSPGELFAFGLRDDELALARRLGADSAVNGADDRGGCCPRGSMGAPCVLVAHSSRAPADEASF